MASIVKRGPFQFQAQVRRKGFKPQQHTTFGEALARYACKVDFKVTAGYPADKEQATLQFLCITARSSDNRDGHTGMSFQIIVSP